MTALAATMGGIALVLTLQAPAATAETRAVSAAEVSQGKTLNVHWVRQEKYYWCGPATAHMVLSARMGSKAPSQRALSPMAENDRNTYRTEMRDTLNRRLGDPFYVVMTDKSTFHKRVVQNVKAGYAVAAGILVQPGGPRPPGYPSNQEIDHWVAVIGYSGDRILVADPVSGRPGYTNVPKKYWVSVSSFKRYLKVYVG